MLKHFSISLIIIASAVYMTIFFMAKHYDTSFFDEILIQLNRLSTSASHKNEVLQTKYILKLIHDNETPPEQWGSVIRRPLTTNARELFYHYKVWMIKSGLTAVDIQDSYPIFRRYQDEDILINMRYGPDKPVVRFQFSPNTNGVPVCGLFFPINESPFSADLNKDRTIDINDVRIAAGKS